jgi:hypothetical protein
MERNVNEFTEEAMDMLTGGELGNNFDTSEFIKTHLRYGGDWPDLEDDDDDEDLLDKTEEEELSLVDTSRSQDDEEGS